MTNLPKRITDEFQPPECLEQENQEYFEMFDYVERQKGEQDSPYACREYFEIMGDV